MGAGTFNPATFLRSSGRTPGRWPTWSPPIRPTDGRYGENPYRLGHYYQYQVILKPCPDNVQDLYLASLEHLGIDLSQHDVRFVEDDWESPTLGAWGLGWEVWIDGMECTQFTYFQQVGGIDLDPPSVELTYGTERLTMYLQGVDNVFDLEWVPGVTYGDVHKANEAQYSVYNFELADIPTLQKAFTDYERECERCLERGLPRPAYDFVLKTSHTFNMLDARGRRQRDRAHRVHRPGAQPGPQSGRRLTWRSLDGQRTSGTGRDGPWRRSLRKPAASRSGTRARRLGRTSAAAAPAWNAT